MEATKFNIGRFFGNVDIYQSGEIILETLLEVKDLIHRYNQKVVLDIEGFELSKGEVLALIGPNGAGKSTFLRILNLLEKPTQGIVNIFGITPINNRQRHNLRKKMVMIFQEPLLFKSTVYNNVSYGLRMRKKNKDFIKNKVLEALEKFGISHLINRQAGTLSGGEAQRVSLARALVLEPEILLLDEPFAALDQPTREELREDLYKIIRRENQTTLHVTHDRNEALVISDNVAVINEGEIIQRGRTEDVFNRPIDEFVANFLGVETILYGKITSKRDGLCIVNINNHKLEVVSDLKVGKRVITCIRPENVTLLKYSLKAPLTSARNSFISTIKDISSYGLVYRVVMDCGFNLTAFITRESLDRLNLKIGEKIIANIKATSIHLLSRK